MKINRFFPFAFLYYFLNTLGLPFGLSWVAVLAPFFYVWVVLERKKDILLPFLALLFPFIFMHVVVVGVELGVYVVSLLNILMLYFFFQAVYTFLKVCHDPEPIFRRILIINFIFCLVGILFYFTALDHWFWIEQELTKGVTGFKRFKLFTYEASIYATLFVPIFFFYLLQYVFVQNRIKNYWLLPMLFLPFILSFSIGVIAACIIAGLFTTIVYFRRIAAKRRVVNMFINVGVLVAAVLFILVFYFRNNPLFVRITNIFSGNDSSTAGRTEEAFMLAQKMLAEKSEYWGIGLGQLKILGHDIVNDYYLYNREFVATIPNVTAETLAVFGWTGVILKFMIEIFLFFYTKVWTNYYRLMLFFFMFVYQFAGSFLTNMAEYVIWILAFSNVFRQFDVKFSQRQPAASIITAS